MKRWFALAVLFALVGCAGQPDSARAPALSEQQLMAGPEAMGVPSIEVDMLALDAEMRSFLDRHVPRGTREREKTRLLMQAFFGSSGIDIRYNNILTHTAAETFHLQSGNCLSFTNLFVAMARELGLKASFQEVETPPSWNSAGELYIYNRHINVLLEYRTGLDQVVDFDIANFDENYARRKISDRAAEAQYHNNMSVHWMLQEDLPRGLAHLREALDLSPDASYMWANLGALYSRMQLEDHAEAAWLTALAKNRNEYIAMSNLARLYAEQSQPELAEQYRQQAARFRGNNPYYLYARAQRQYQDGQFDLALENVQRAISLDDSEHQFFRLQGLAQLQLDAREQAHKSFARAAALNAEPRYEGLYARKLQLLAGH